MRLFLVDEDNQFFEYEEQDFKAEHYEEHLEAWLASNPKAIVEDDKLLIIGRQVSTELGLSIDLLGLDREGNVAVVELKRDRTPRETLAQVIEYAAFAATLSYVQLEQIFLDYSGDEGLSLSDTHREFFELTEDEAVSFNKEQRLVIIGQTVTPQIRKSATFLRQKGIRITCLEFKYFKTGANQRILSTDVVVGEELLPNKTITTEKRPRTDKVTFLASCTPQAKPLYERLLDLAERQNLPIHWGVSGFSLNVGVKGRHVALCYGYPASNYNSALHTAFDRVEEHVTDGTEIVSNFREQFIEAGFLPMGSKRQLKYTFERPVSESQIELITKIFENLAHAILQRELD